MMKTFNKEHEFYPTPPNLAAKMVEVAREELCGMKPKWWLEPSMGDGAIVEQINAQGVNSVIGVDPNIKPMAKLFGDFYDHGLEEYLEAQGSLEFGAIVGNPPFSLAEKHLRLLIPRIEPGGVLVFLLRMTFLGSKSRVEFFKEHPPSKVIVLQGRPSFTSDGKTDSSEYGLFIWKRDGQLGTRLEWSEWK
tara:strand:+ start:377 stop:949 length:573 start_codon:yes stop_codon:yes gene_type:complete